MSGADRVWGVTPFGRACPDLVIALGRAGAFGLLAVDGSDEDARVALRRVASRLSAPWGVRLASTCPLEPEELPGGVTTVLLAAGDPVDEASVRRWQPRRVVVEVTSLAEAHRAAAAGADGLVAKGSECGGRIGEVGAFVLLQQLAAIPDLPRWCQGGMGLHTAAAAVAGGARGIVLDAQLALVKESGLPAAVRAAIGSMDGGETAVVGGHRVFTRPDLSLPDGTGASPVDVAARLGTDLPSRLLAVGQDGAFARELARRFGTAGGVVSALGAAMDAELDQAAEDNVLGPGSPFAQAYGLDYPIAQGPMTRVSDRPAFAAAVAGAGGLPFLALALMEPGPARSLLEETAATLGPSPWGVGILGFVPPELRSAQLEAVRQVRPPVALVAGGRPSLAKPLEDEGIATFLHVPSPGLLELFVREGARRFVFEGRECGGHVGPRSSFVLWEQQVETLLRGDVEGMDVLFAGGVHDARSAAMVAALAGPLARGGARIGVLMGTAYLFTAEAVAAGAIQPAFQETAVACQRTALLETAPGHTTRGAATAYAGRFESERRRLEEAGIPPSQRWAALEDLNLGRLRIAAKGLRRRDGELIAVDDETQRADGFYMLGQVATLRDATTTVAELHHQVSVGSGAVLARGRADHPRPDRSPPARRLDVAIVGMAASFAGASDRPQLWANILAGRRAITEVPPERFDADLYASSRGSGERGVANLSRWGGFLPPIPFDPMGYGIPPASLGSIEPAQLLSLEMAARALADAGYAEHELDRSRTAVVFGAEGATDLATAYGFRAIAPTYLGSMPAELDRRLPTLTEDSFPGVLTNVIAGRIANRLDLGGLNCTTDAACAASLAALRLACQELVTGSADTVLCGGVDLHNGIYDYQLFASVQALSPTGGCRTFDAGADGIALGEGVACLVLKRLADAERDGNRIYAVVEGIGGSSDGRSLGLTAPRPEGQRSALERAYAQAGVSPTTVGLVEAHGTGTVVGDRTELAALTGVFAGVGSAPATCALGSVKALVGHTKCAAGMAGLVKAALAVYHGVRPPTAHLSEANRFYDPATSPFTFDPVARPWPSPTRRAGVSAFGFGGANFHVVLSSYGGADRPAHGLDAWPAELVVVRAPEASRLAPAIDDLLRRVGGDGDQARYRSLTLARLARDQWDKGEGPVRVAVVASDLDDLATKLAQARGGQAGPGVHLADAGAVPGADPAPPEAALRGTPGSPGTEPTEGCPRVAFLFPGQGSQRPGMLADLFVAFPRLQEVLEPEPELVDTMFPPVAFGPDQAAAQRAALTDTRAAQPALGLAEMAAARLLRALGLRPSAVGGHSYGELVALHVAGALGQPDLVRLSRARAEAMLSSAGPDPGAMVAVRAGAASLGELVARWPDVVVANDNSPDQVVLSGPTPAIVEVTDWLAGQGMAGRRLPVACGFHSPLMAGAGAKLAPELAGVALCAPSIPVWSNHTAQPYPSDPDGARRLLAAQLASPVRFREQVEAMYRSGIRIFVEVGPGQALTALVGQTLRHLPHLGVSIDRPGRHGLAQLLEALGALAVAGVPLDPEALFGSRDLEADGGPSAAPVRWLVDGHLVRTADGTPVPGGLQPATAVCPPPGGDPVPPALAPAGGVDGSADGLAAASAAGSDREKVLVEYLRNARQAAAAAHDLVGRYLDGRPAAGEAGETPAGDRAEQEELRHESRSDPG
ncbi:MAG: beta-ketoacyl synthase N-terminal-like domain-containing protein, partial [Acidimicrobiales bacterium]